MDAEQRGWYIQLLAESWESRPQATLPNDPALLHKLAGADDSSPNFEPRWAFVIAQFKVKNDLLINLRLNHEKRKQIDYHEQRKQAGAKGAKKRWREPQSEQQDTAIAENGSAIAQPSARHDSANGKPIAKNSSSVFSLQSSSSSSEEEVASAAKPRSPGKIKLCDEEFLDGLQKSEAYASLNVRRCYARLLVWCENNHKQATRGRLISWLNREDQPLNGNGSAQAPKLEDRSEREAELARKMGRPYA